MKLKYGTHTHSIDEASIIINKELIEADDGTLRGIRETWDIDGMLTSTSISGVTTAITALETAYSTNGYDIYLLQDDGSSTAHSIISATTSKGVIVKAAGYPVGDQGEYSTFRRYKIRVEAEVTRGNNFPGGLRTFTQQVSIRGTGGPRTVVRELRYEQPVVQTVSQWTPVHAIQSGRATSFLIPVVIPAPFWPQYEMVPQREITHVDVRANVYESSWAYFFESPVSL